MLGGPGPGAADHERSPQPAMFLRRSRRLHALAGAYESLSHHAWGDVRLRDVIERQLKAHAGSAGRVA